MVVGGECDLLPKLGLPEAMASGDNSPAFKG